MHFTFQMKFMNFLPTLSQNFVGNAHSIDYIKTFSLHFVQRNFFKRNLIGKFPCFVCSIKSFHSGSKYKGKKFYVLTGISAIKTNLNQVKANQ